MTRRLRHLTHRHLYLVVAGYEIRTCTSPWTGKVLRVEFRRIGRTRWIRRYNNDLDGLVTGLTGVTA